jgi:hypothetical protein
LRAAKDLAPEYILESGRANVPPEEFIKPAGEPGGASGGRLIGAVPVKNIQAMQRRDANRSLADLVLFTGRG